MKLKFHCLRNSTSIFVNDLVGSFTLLYIISKLYIHPNGYGVVVLCGFNVLLILFVTYVYLYLITRWYIIVVTWALVVYLIYTPSALGLWVYISSKPLLSMLQLYNVYISRLTVVSREAKKKQHACMSFGLRYHYSEYLHGWQL